MGNSINSKNRSSKSATAKVKSATKRASFPAGTRVTWSHPPTGKAFSGQVIATVPAGFVIGARSAADVRDRLMSLARTRGAVRVEHRTRFLEAVNKSVDQIGSGASRDHASYLVCSSDGRLHWPDSRWLTRGRGRPTRNIAAFEVTR